MYNHTLQVTRNDLLKRVRKLLLIILRDRERTKEYELLCSQLNVNLTPKGKEVRYTILDNTSIKELLRLFDILITLVR